MSRTDISRRDFCAAGSAIAATALAGCATTPSGSAGKVVVIGGGFGGATAAKHLRLWSSGAIDVVLVEPGRAFVSCPMSNLVLAGSRSLADITAGYEGLGTLGVRLVHERAVAIDAGRRQVRLASGTVLPYDRLVVSPGVEFMFERVQGYSADAAQRVPHAWKAGEQTALLRRQLQALPDGGIVLLAVPLAPYRCPPGPYERACQIGWYLKTQKPKSKLIVLDANPQVTSKGALFTAVWKDEYGSRIEYRPNANVAEVDANGLTFVLDLGERIQGDVLNLIPPMRAADIARDAGLVTANERWCAVDWTTMESVKVPNVHVLGDAALSAPGMPKSGHMANQHGKAAAAAIVELLAGRTPQPPVMTNTCYSMIDDRRAIHVASVHRYDAGQKTMVAVAGAGGLSPADRSRWVLEGGYAWGWAQSIWADTLGA
ncbi:MAG: FAD-dependent oxidoreductase [Burkholderiaceae bacterium]|nr:FAD-dependent oxidoreductase [Burkholderiaceae bacterium]